MLYAARLESAKPVKPWVRKQYLNFLFKHDKWQKAYMVWLSGLDEKERKSLGYLYDGGFENEFSYYGFYWHAYKNKAAKIEQTRVRASSGKKALKITFLNKPVPFYHVLQITLLRPGSYLFKGKVKKDGLTSNRGINWRISCKGQSLLAQSIRFNGMEHWQSFEVEFKVPEQKCNAQEIRLVSNGKNKSDYKIKGALWFDDLSIAQVHRPNR